LIQEYVFVHVDVFQRKGRLKMNLIRRMFLMSLATALLAGAAMAQMAMSPGMNMSEMKFMNLPGMPTCATGAIANGDPTKGPSVILAKINTGCSIPWHWHTSNEHLMFVSGSAIAEMKDGGKITLKPGAYAQMPATHVHQFRCTSACSMYVYSDAPFDIHYVDAKGAEITADKALKSIKETVAAVPK
jgi:quercetin dioxygenase-like cupin family protein